MDIAEFIKNFPDEKYCMTKFKEIRDKQGVICSNCGSNLHYWKRDKWQYECKKCKTRTTLKSGTILHGSKLPLRYWFIATYLLIQADKNFSIKEIQKQLEHKFYEAIWSMVYKIRQALENKDALFILLCQTLSDEEFFKTSIEEQSESQKKHKYGRTSKKT